MLTIVLAFGILYGLLLIAKYWERESGWIGEDWVRRWLRGLGRILVVGGSASLIFLHWPELLAIAPVLTWK